MSEQENRLIRCFAAVFPWLSTEELREIRADASPEWDSLSAVTLVSVVQEEFSVEVSPEVLATLDSFESFREFVSHSNHIGA